MDMALTVVQFVGLTALLLLAVIGFALGRVRLTFVLLGVSVGCLFTMAGLRYLMGQTTRASIGVAIACLGGALFTHFLRRR